MNLDIYLILGWLGMILLILGYFLLSSKRLNPHSKLYHLINFFGSLGIVLSALKTKSWPAMTLNMIWAIIAIFYFYKLTKIKPKYKQIRG